MSILLFLFIFAILSVGAVGVWSMLAIGAEADEQSENLHRIISVEELKRAIENNRRV